MGEGRSSILWVDDSPEAPAEVKVKQDVDEDVDDDDEEEEDNNDDDDDGDDNKDGDDGRQLRGTSWGQSKTR